MAGDQRTEQLAALSDVIRHVVRQDLPDLPAEDRERLVGHLTNVIYVALPFTVWNIAKGQG